MAVRTTAELVAGVIEIDEEIPLEPFIKAASILIDRVAAADAAARTVVNGVYFLDPVETGDPTVEEQLQTVETYLAAHFYTLRDPRPTQEGAGSVSVTYQSAVSLNLYTSHYGGMAMMLDVTGTLRDISNGKKKQRASVTWIGKKPC